MGTDIFRPVHLTCPKHSYRKTLTDDDEINMSVITRNTKYDYVEVKMIDADNPQLSEMKVYMTPQQLFEHCTTYFHFTEMKPIEQDIPNNAHDHASNNNGIQKSVIHDIPPSISPPPPNYSPSHIHQYMRSKDSSLSPQRRLHNLSISHNSPEIIIQHDPRSHLLNEDLRSFLHDTGDEDGGDDDQKENENINITINWKDSRFSKSSGSGTESVDLAFKNTKTNSISPQQFIDQNWNARPDRMGLGSNSGHGLGLSDSNSFNTSFNKVNDSDKTRSKNDSALLFPSITASKNTSTKKVTSSNLSTTSSSHSRSPSMKRSDIHFSDENIRIHNELNNVNRIHFFHLLIHSFIYLFLSYNICYVML